MIFGLFHESEGDTTMAEGQSLTTREAVQEVLASEHADVLRESVALMVRESMELEVAQLAGAELGERAPGRRQAQRNGYRRRAPRPFSCRYTTKRDLTPQAQL
jgi:transposase-like protein